MSQLTLLLDDVICNSTHNVSVMETGSDSNEEMDFIKNTRGVLGGSSLLNCYTNSLTM